MIKKRKHIEIVRSSVISLSSMSEESSNAVLTVLLKHFSVVKVTTVDSLSDLQSLASRKPDLVFLGVQFIPLDSALGAQDPDGIWISKYLEDRDIAFTGSSRSAHELQRNKPDAKRRAIESNLLTSPFCVIKQDQIPNRADVALAYPLFIKPTNRGGGLGIDSDSVAYNFEQLAAKVRSISSVIQSDSIVEEYLPGREFSVAILRNESSENFSVMPIELIAPKDKNGVRMLSDRVKTSNSEEVIEVSDTELDYKVSTLALDVFHALGARDYGRIDIRLDKNGEPHFLEANLIPSLISGYGSFPKACVLNIGLEYEFMIVRIVKLGLDRGSRTIEKSTDPVVPDDVVFSPLETVA